jgi:hypothetical protein
MSKKIFDMGKNMGKAKIEGVGGMFVGEVSSFSVNFNKPKNDDIFMMTDFADPSQLINNGMGSLLGTPMEIIIDRQGFIRSTKEIKPRDITAEAEITDDKPKEIADGKSKTA